MTEWIDVNLQLPKYGTRVLVQDVLVRVGVLQSTDKCGHTWHLDGGADGVIVARNVRFWQPLPK